MPTSKAAPNVTALNAVTALSNTADPLNPSVPNGIITACNVRQRSTALWKQHVPQLDVRLVVLPMSQHWIVHLWAKLPPDPQYHILFHVPPMECSPPTRLCHHCLTLHHRVPSLKSQSEMWAPPSTATVQFHAYNSSGILFYQINSVITDFLGVKMHGGLPWLIFDVGSGPAVVGSNSTRTFIDGQWHTGHVVLFEQASNTFYVTVDTVHAAAITDVIVPLLTMKVYFEGFPSTRADMALQPLTACVLSPPEWYLVPRVFCCTVSSGFANIAIFPERRVLWDSILRIDGLFFMKMALYRARWLNCSVVVFVCNGMAQNRSDRTLDMPVILWDKCSHYRYRLDCAVNSVMAKPVVFVIGASGNVGAATVTALSAKYADKVEIRAGVRNPEAADKLKGLNGVTLVAAEMGGDRDKLVTTLKGVDALFIVTPGTKDRAELAISTAEAARDAGVKFLLVVSVLTADLTDTIFGAQFSKLERAVAQLGVTYSFLRLPLFIENYWGFKDTIKGHSAFYSPVDPDKPFTPVVVSDAGNAAAAILSNPIAHANQTYNLVSNRHTFNDVAASFSEALGREVKYVHVPYEAAKQSLLQMGFQDWQVDGIFELDKLIDSGSHITNQEDLTHYTKITGEKPTELKSWIASVKAAFQ
eukprot:Em0009g930a